MKDLLLIIAGGVLGWSLSKRLAGNTPTTDYISLDNIRRGIENMWYSAKAIVRRGEEYLVRLVGTNTDGSTSNAYYPITKDTYYALLADGVPEETEE